MFRRDVNNYADDSQVLSTGISFPISFKKGIVYGAEGKLEVQDWRGFSGPPVIPTSWGMSGTR